MTQAIEYRLTVALILCTVLTVRSVIDSRAASRFVTDAGGQQGPKSSVGYLIILVMGIQIAGRDVLALPLEGEVAEWCGRVGVAFMVFGGILATWPRVMKERRSVWSGTYAMPDSIPGHRLVTWGAYRFIRHPFYAGMFLSVLAVECACPSLVSLPMLLMLPKIHRGLVAEEGRVEEVYGDEYRAYKARTWRFIPLLY